MSRPAVRTGRLAPLLLAVVVYAVAACWFTWPVVTHLRGQIYGAPGDPFGTIATLRELIQEGRVPFLPGTLTDFNAPDGQAIAWARNLASLPGLGALYLLSLLTSPIAGPTLYTLLGFVASGTAMFLLARRITGSVWASLVAGWAFAFYPYAVINGQGHYDNVHGWVLVLGVWRMLELAGRPSWRNAALAGAAVVFGMWWSPYFILLGGVTWAVLAAYGLLVGARQRAFGGTLRAQALTGVIVAVFLVVLLGLSTRAGGEGTGVRTASVQELITYSARPLEYVVPPSESPLFGGTTGPFLQSRLHGSNPTESTLYVGVTVIALALVALWGALGRGRLEAEQRRWVLGLTAVAFVALATSGPPEVGVLGHAVPLPGHLIAEITTTWRVYARFVIVVMLALSLLAALGLRTLVAGRRGVAVVVVALLAMTLVPLDLWARLPTRTTVLGTPSVYRVLARQPPGLVAEYPLQPAGYGVYSDLFFQQAGGKPIINGYFEGSPDESRALSLSRLSDPDTAPRLAALGVRYVILRNAQPEYPPSAAGRPTRDFRRLAADAYGALYRVAPRSRSYAEARTTTGFGQLEGDPSARFAWLERPTGGLLLDATCDRCRGELRLSLASFNRPRLVRLRAPGGRVLWQGRVGGPTSVRIPVQFRRHSLLSLSTAPGPESISAATGTADGRSVSVQVIDPRLVLSRPAIR